MNWSIVHVRGKLNDRMRLLICCVLFLSCSFIHAQSQPRLVLPVGHGQDWSIDIKCQLSSNGNYLFSYEDSIFIVWDYRTKKELFRRVFDGGLRLNEIIDDSEKLDKVLISARKGEREDLVIIDYRKNSAEVFQNIVAKGVLYQENTSLILIGNKDSVKVFDAGKYQYIGDLDIDIWEAGKYRNSGSRSRSGNLAYPHIEYFLYNDRDSKNSCRLYTYEPSEEIKIKYHEFDFDINKVLYLDSNHVLIQKSSKEKDENGFFQCYVLSLSDKKLSKPISFHKYNLNQFINGIDGQVVSIGNDGRIVKWDRSMKPVLEVDVKKKYKLPSFSKISLDPVNQIISFQARLKCKKPNEKADSIEYNGFLDYSTFNLLSFKSRSVYSDNSESEESFFLGSELEESEFLRGYDIEINIDQFKNTDSVVELNNGTVHFNSDFTPSFRDSVLDFLSTDTLHFVKDDKLLELADSLLIRYPQDVLFTKKFLKALKKAFYKERNEKNKFTSEWYIASDVSPSDKIKIEEWRRNLDTTSEDYIFLKERYGPVETIAWNQLVEAVKEGIMLDSIEFINLLLFNKDTVFQSRNELFLYKVDEKEILFELNYQGDLNLYLLKKGKIADSILSSRLEFELMDVSLTRDCHLKAECARPIFLTVTKERSHLKRDWRFGEWVYPHPNRNIHFIDTLDAVIEKNESWYELYVVKDRLQLIRVDSVEQTDFIGGSGESYLKGFPFLISSYAGDELAFSLVGNRIKRLEILGHNKRGQFNYLSTFLPDDDQKDELPFLKYNSMSSLRNLIGLTVDISSHDLLYDPVKKSVYSNLRQEYYPEYVELQEDKIFLGANVEKKNVLVYNKTNGFIEVRTYADQLKYSIVLMEGNNYLIFDPDYHYDGTPGAIEKLYFVCDLEIVELSQIKDSLYVPNLAQRILNGENLKHIPKLSDLNICGITPLVEPIDMDKNGKHSYRIQPRSGGVGDVEVYINGVVRYQTGARDLEFSDGNYILQLEDEMVKRYRVPGEELIVKVIAKTANNSISSRGVKVEVPAEKIMSLKKPSLHAVMIGVDDYVGVDMDLNYAAKDASDLQQVLQAAAKKYFNIDDTNRVFFYSLVRDKNGDLKGQTPDKGNIMNTLKNIEAQSKPEDIFLLFFAGHGEIIDKDQLLLLTAESSRDKFDGIRVRELLEQMNKIPAGKRVLILDACYSGAAINNLDKAQYTGKRDITDAERESQRLKELDKLASKSGFAIITASSSDQKALELPQYEHGLMTYALLNSMLNNPSALDENQQLQLEKWLMATEEEVRKLNTDQRAERMVPINFTLGKVDEEVRNKIQLIEIPTVYVKNVLNSELGWDDLDVESKLNGYFSGHVRGGDNDLLLAHQEQSNAAQVNIQYTRSKKLVTVKVTIIKNKQIHNQFNRTGNESQLDGLIREIAHGIEEGIR